MASYFYIRKLEMQVNAGLQLHDYKYRLPLIFLFYFHECYITLYTEMHFQ